MSLNFPPSPEVNDTYTALGNTWRWDGSAWNVVPTIESYVSVDGAQTVTNKTISGAQNTLSSIPQSAITDLTGALASKLDLAGGKILQIVRATDSTNRTTTSSTYVDVTGMSVTITPQKSDSAVLVVASFYGAPVNSNGDRAGQEIRITDASNNALSGAESVLQYLQVSTLAANFDLALAQVLIGRVTPATTSPVTYKLRFNNLGIANNTARVMNNVTTGQMYAIEVSA